MQLPGAIASEYSSEDRMWCSMLVDPTELLLLPLPLLLLLLLLLQLLLLLLPILLLLLLLLLLLPLLLFDMLHPEIVNEKWRFIIWQEPRKKMKKSFSTVFFSRFHCQFLFSSLQFLIFISSNQHNSSHYISSTRNTIHWTRKDYSYGQLLLLLRWALIKPQ